jgi:peroxisomal 3,2-trans-enoyl-CoA isomerase
MFTWLFKVWKFLVKLILGAKDKKVKAKGEYETIIVDRAIGDGIVRIIFNRPRRKNAFNSVMYHEISEALNDLSNDATVKACIITGAGDFYSSGNDLANFSVIMHPLQMAKEARETCDMFVSAFVNFKKPLIGVVNGPAIGIAATTLGLFDHIFACDRTYFKTPFAELGQSPEGCSSFVFPKIMGEKLAHEVLWESKKLSAEDALNAHFVHEILPAGELDSAAAAYAKRLVGSVPVEKVAQLHWPVKEGLVQKLQAVNQAELDTLQKKWVSKECFLALAAFLESRNLRFAALVLRYARFS